MNTSNHRRGPGRRPCRFRRAFTLVEVSLSMATMIVVLGGVAGAMALSSRAIPTRNNEQATVLSSAEALAQLSDELRYTSTVVLAGENQIVFAIGHDADRRKVEYAWSGEEGDPLTKQFSDSDRAMVLPAVDGFQFTYMTGIPRQAETGMAESEETLLAAHDPAANQSAYEIKSQQWIGQCWSLTLPERATSWSITRVKFLARAVSKSRNGALAIQIRLADKVGLPSPTVLDRFLLQEASLSDNFTWHEVAFQDLGELSPDQQVCLVINVGRADDDLGEIAFDKASGSGLVTTASAEAAWKVETNKAMQYQLFGTYKARSTAEPQAEVINQIRIALTPTNGRPMHALVTTLNTPAMPDSR